MHENALPVRGSEQDDDRLKSERYEEFLEALEVLYIEKNRSGRLAFCKAWPEAAAYLFGEELMALDRDGGGDAESQAALEEAAVKRQFLLLDSVENLEKKSVEDGVLRLEYVESTIKNLGRDLALCLYAEKIVDRFIAPPPLVFTQSGIQKTAEFRKNPLDRPPE